MIQEFVERGFHLLMSCLRELDGIRLFHIQIKVHLGTRAKSPGMSNLVHSDVAVISCTLDILSTTTAFTTGTRNHHLQPVGILITYFHLSSKENSGIRYLKVLFPFEAVKIMLGILNRLWDRFRIPFPPSGSPNTSVFVSSPEVASTFHGEEELSM